MNGKKVDEWTQKYGLGSLIGRQTQSPDEHSKTARFTAPHLPS
jgi:hypothetical protein